ncbi:hypothetical protein ACIOGZ_32420 [Kitasatospora sp. NPDC088160]|uniref:DUF7507 domain-containing protein n=1 Tax=Kitasatospora sp. NPDC088160 TaxID=3364072 RepID=UPI003806C743
MIWLARRTALACLGLLIASLWLAVPTTASAAPTLTQLDIAGNCSLSFSDTDASGVAYFIVEPIGTSGDPCQFQLTGPQGTQVADVTVTGDPAVVYVGAAGTYSELLTDVTQGSTAGFSNPTVTGSPALPALPAGEASSGGCSKALQQRTVAGAVVPQYATGWNIVSSDSGGACTNQVGAVGTNPSGTVTGTTVQVAIPDPFGLSLAKSATAGGAPITTAQVGQTVTYQYTVTNTGPVPWTAVAVDDPLPGLSSISCPGTPLAAGQSQTCQATYTPSAADGSAGSVTNTATASGVDGTRPFATGATVTSGPATARLNITTASPSPSPSPSASPSSSPSPSASPSPSTTTAPPSPSPSTTTTTTPATATATATATGPELPETGAHVGPAAWIAAALIATGAGAAWFGRPRPRRRRR